jgi:hypothetical protein
VKEKEAWVSRAGQAGVEGWRGGGAQVGVRGGVGRKEQAAPGQPFLSMAFEINLLQLFCCYKF